MSKMLKLSLVMALIFVLGVPFAFAKSTERRSKPIPVSTIVPVADMVAEPPKVVTEYPVTGVKYQTTCEDINPQIGTIIQHDQVGSTYYDNQHYGPMGRMIAVGPGGERELIFMRTNGSYDYPRWVTYNCKDSLGNWCGGASGFNVDGGSSKAGYVNIAAMHDGREVIIYHRAGAIPGSTPWYTTLSVGDSGKVCSNLNTFTLHYDVPDSLEGQYRGMWPKVAVMYDDSVDTDYIHTVMTEGTTSGVNQRLGYTRCHLIAGNNLLCETPTGQPGVISPIIILPNRQLWPNANVAYFGEVEAPGVPPGEYPSNMPAIVVTSPVSERVAIVFTNKRQSGDNPYNNDVFYFESINNGNDWFPQFGGTWPPTIANGMLHNITNYPTDATERAYTDVAACYDYNDSLHIVWTATWYDSVAGQTSNDANLYHWSKATGITMIAEGYWGGTDPGWFDRNISKMSISAMDPIYHPGGDPDSVYLYCIWTQFDSADNSANGYTNGDIFAAASTDGGSRWGPAFNLTNTKTPGCLPGNCLSEHWSSLAQDLHNGNLHIQYVCDRDAGEAIQSEGSWTDNPVIYFELPAWNPGEPPLIAWFSATPRTGFAPLEVHFADRSNGNPTSWLWNFGDDSTSTKQHPTHTYTDTGYFDVKLVISNGIEIDSVIKYDYIHVLPIVGNFSAEPESGLVPLIVHFADSSIGNPTSWFWEFGDGGTDTVQNPTHIYNDTGYFDVKLIAGNQWQSDTVAKLNYIHVLPHLTADFSANPDSGLPPLSVQFNDLSIGRPTSWLWYFGDGDSSDQQNPVHIYSCDDTGYLDVQLIVQNQEETDTLINDSCIYVSAETGAKFGAVETYGVIPLTVQFIDSSFGCPASWFWDFGDGSTDTVQNPAHTYNDTGYFDVKLVVSNETDTDSLIKQNYIHVLPFIINFSAEPISGLVPLQVQFTDSTQGNLTSWRWDFGDGSGDIMQNPLHIYNERGNYDVKLVVSNAQYTDSLTKQDYIHAQIPPCPEDPNDLGICDTLYVETFDCDHYYDATGGYDSVRVAIYVTHDANAFWWYEGNQWVQDSIPAFVVPLRWWKVGCADSVVLPKYNNWNNAYFSSTKISRSIFRDLVDSHTGDTTSNRMKYLNDQGVGWESRYLDITSGPDSGHFRLFVIASGMGDREWWEGSRVLLATITFLVYMGDTCQSSEICLDSTFWPPETNLMYVRHDAVAYTPRHFLPVKDTIYSYIKVAFGADKRCGSVPLTVAFTDSSTGPNPITEWHWNFGDGDTSNLQNPTHVFQDTGVFDITLVVSDGVHSNSVTKKDYITTQDSISADFFGLPNSGRSPLTVMFEPVLEGIANHYFWDFGDGDTSTLRNPIHIYTTQGKYDVTFKVRLELDDCNQVDSVMKGEYVSVHNLRTQFSADKTEGVAPLIVHFADSSSGNPDGWFWDFGDGNTSTEQNSQHQYDTAGIYDVFLRVSNSFGVDSLLKLDYIHIDTPYVDLYAEMNSSRARPGFDLWFDCYWTNIGTIPAENCTLKVLRPPEMTFSNVYPGDIRTGTYSGYSFLGDTIIIPLQTINPSNWYGGYVRVYGNLPTSVPIGDTLVCQMWLTSTTPDRNYNNNYVLHRRVVIGSWDPNDKLASPEGEGTSHAIEPDQRLAYTIQFENKKEATAEAIYIRVVDTLDQDLNWGSLAIGASSHPDKCHYEFDPYTGVIVWFCDSIMLPPNQNPPEGEGYFTFSISPKPELVEGTEISNKAWIRFDYNEWLQAPEEGPVIRTIKYPFIRGDANRDGVINSADVSYLINYLFITGPAPQPLQAGDANCDGIVNSADVAYLINYLFVSGPPPGC